jgi:polyphosphate kinase
MTTNLIPKEISWLAFNECVLEEAADETVPVLQRLRFLGIFSSNLDEFFRVRVAALRQVARLKKKGKEILGFDPREVLGAVDEIVQSHNRRFDEVYRLIVLELFQRDISLIDEKSCTSEQGEFVKAYFRTEVRQRLNPILVHRQKEFPVLRDQSIYFFVVLESKNSLKKSRLALIELPTQLVPRFLILPEREGKRFIMLLDDVIRYCLGDIFSMFEYDSFAAYTIKLTRDAELDVDVDFSESMIKKISKSLRRRKEGIPVRFVHDADLPAAYLDFLTVKLHLKKDQSVIAGGRYHNFRDFVDFPDLCELSLEYPLLPPIIHGGLKNRRTIISAVRKNDLLFHYPYNSFDHFVDFLREAAIDPKVRSIKITIYRVAKHSSVLNALINAARNGKAVTVIVELQARFDEEANIKWAAALKEEGVFVNYGVPGLKVHAKLCLVTRKENGGFGHYASVATGNFNEDTARVYTDHCLLTADQRITGEVRKVFDFLESTYKLKRFEHLAVSPFGLRDRVMALIDAEIARASGPVGGRIVMKLNNLTDEIVIRKLYEASAAGVAVRLMVRGMNSLVAGLSGVSESINVTRIVDRFLEHTRILYFQNGGEELFFLSSADMMPRNLDQRIEVVCPVYAKSIKEELRTVLSLSLHDGVKARPVNGSGARTERRRTASPVRSQEAIYEYIQTLNLRRERKRKGTHANRNLDRGRGLPRA